ncbi:MAG TPA: sugar phosphate isomerase/epimerase family protein [Planctomycetota bacterium]|nr:sugar phosphate isomerase/epimerase family protein [Planctomycetota bacterium]
MNNDIGVMAPLQAEGPSLKAVADFGLKCCQLVSWKPKLWTADAARRLVEESRATGVRMTAFWAGWPGPARWDLVEGPATLGLVPWDYRQERVEALVAAGGFARALGVPAVITHLGFIPESPVGSLFGEVVETVRGVAEHLESLGVEFWFETGQETPVTMLRLISQVGTGNLGVNLDPANLILYGKGSPVDALDVLGPYVRNVHAKDGLYPTDPMKLGTEVRVGQGRVRFPEFVRRLGEIGFKGEFIIEREISGEEQRRDIAGTVEYLRGLLAAN